MVSVIGLKVVNFTAADSRVIKGRKIFVAFESNGVEGMETDSIFLSDDKFGDVEIVVGLDYKVSYNRYGKVETLTKA